MFLKLLFLNLADHLWFQALLVHRQIVAAVIAAVHLQLVQLLFQVWVSHGALFASYKRHFVMPTINCHLDDALER